MPHGFVAAQYQPPTTISQFHINRTTLLQHQPWPHTAPPSSTTSRTLTPTLCPPMSPMSMSSASPPPPWKALPSSLVNIARRWTVGYAYGRFCACIWFKQRTLCCVSRRTGIRPTVWRKAERWHGARRSCKSKLRHTSACRWRLTRVIFYILGLTNWGRRVWLSLMPTGNAWKRTTRWGKM